MNENFKITNVIYDFNQIKKTKLLVDKDMACVVAVKDNRFNIRVQSMQCLDDEIKKIFEIPKDWNWITEYMHKNPISFIRRTQYDNNSVNDEFLKELASNHRIDILEKFGLTLLDIESFNQNNNYQFISYNKENLSKNKFDVIMQPFYHSDFKLCNKPIGGIWACMYTPDKEWDSNWDKYLTLFGDICDKERSESKVLFTLKKNSNILVIDTYDDFVKLLNLSSIADEEYEKENRNVPKERQIDFIKLLMMGYDGIYLTENAQKEVCGTNMEKTPSGWCGKVVPEVYKKENLCHWSIESLLLFNYDCIDKVSKGDLKDSKIKDGVK